MSLICKLKALSNYINAQNTDGYYSSMKLINPICLCLLLITTASINQTCSLIQPCPANAGCSPLTNYCACDPGYLADCGLKADELAQYPQLIELSPYTRQLLYVRPLELEEFIEITVTVCRQKDRENVPVTLFLWIENGTIEEYGLNNTLGHPVGLSFESQCRTHTVKLEVGLQPNGESELVVVGLGGNQHKVILSLTADQKIIQGASFYYFIMVGLVVFIIALSIVSGVSLIMRRRRWMGFFSSQGQGYIVDNAANLDHFQIFMPSHAAKKSAEKPLCPICLQHIEADEFMRNTPCEHKFHTACLDSWCVGHLNCPVCRSDFSPDKIAVLSQREGRDEGGDRRDQRKERRDQRGEQRAQVELSSQENARQLRQQMLD